MRGLARASVYAGDSAFVETAPDPSLQDVGEADVPPTREVRSTDASKLSFPIQMVIAIVVSALSASATIWATQRYNDRMDSDMRSDIRNILTQMSNARELEISNRQLQSERATATKEAVDDVKRQVQQLQAQYMELSRQIAARR